MAYIYSFKFPVPLVQHPSSQTAISLKREVAPIWITGAYRYAGPFGMHPKKIRIHIYLTRQVVSMDDM